MPYYSFCQKSNVTTVEEHFFRVRADTYAQAVERIRSFTDHDESSVKLLVEQNHGQPTIRIFNDRNELITHNQVKP